MLKTYKQYLREVSKRIPSFWPEKKAFLASFEHDVADYLASHPNADGTALAAHFGSPEEIGFSFLSELSYEQIQERISSSRKIVTAVAVIGAVILLMVFAALAGMIIYNCSQVNGYYTTVIQ